MSNLYRKSLIEKMSNPEQLDKTVRITSSCSWLALAGIALIIAAVMVWAVLGRLPETVSALGIISPTADVYALYSDSSGIVSEIKKQSGKFTAGDEIIVVSNGAERNCTVKADNGGVLSQLLVEQDSVVFRGQEIARYTPEIDDEAVVVCYVPITQAQTLKTGMKAQLAPIFSDGKKDGHMEGEIIHIGSYAASTAAMSFVLGDAATRLPEQFAANGAVCEVVFRIKTDEKSDNGFYWTNERGKRLVLPDGTLVSASIITSEVSPLSKLIGGFGGEK